MAAAIRTPVEPCTDAKQIADWLRLFRSPGEVTELRAIAVTPDGRYPHTESGFYDHERLGDMAGAAARLSGIAKGVYFTLNPLKPEMLSRRANRTAQAKEGELATDKCVLARKWLLIDADPARPVDDIPSSDEEKQAAWDLTVTVQASLESALWPDPILADSGNGYHLLYRIDLPADDDGLVKRVLNAVADMFDTDKVKIDRKVFNPARICKLYGTLARKGDHTEARPHRLSNIVEIPRELTAVSKDLLKNVATMARHKPEANGKPAKSAAPDAAPLVHMDRGAMVRRAAAYIAKIPAAVAGNNGHDQTFRVAAILVRGFDLTADEARPLMKDYSTRCDPPWTDSEIEHKLKDAEKQTGSRGYLLADKATNTAGQNAPGERKLVTQVYQFQPQDSPTFFGRDYRQTWLVERLLVRGQPCIIGGPKKSLKTSFLIALAIALGSGTDFLGRFKVYRTVRVAILSGESGEFTIQETGLRICRELGIDPASLNIVWDFKLPQLADIMQMDALCKGLRELQIEVVIIDPAYLCLLGGAGREIEAQNLFQMGPLLLNIAQACQFVNCTPLLVFHARKNLTSPYEPMDLEDLAYAGIQEFARQWLLFNRRERYELGTGRHRLWLSAGGSIGHSGLWGVNVNEGTLDEHFGGRKWEVAVQPVGELREQEQEAGDSAKEAKLTEKEKSEDAKLLCALDKLDQKREGVSFSKVKDMAHVGAGTMTRAVARLVEAKLVEEITLEIALGSKAKRSVPGLRRMPLKVATDDHSDDSDDHSDGLCPKG